MNENKKYIIPIFVSLFLGGHVFPAVAKPKIAASILEKQYPSKKKKKKKSKATKWSFASWKSRKSIKEMNYQELVEAKDRYVADGEYRIAFKYIEKINRLETDPAVLREIHLELADLLFDMEDMVKAEAAYTRFSTEYPGNKKADYALYRAILCSVAQVRDKERDQTKTRDTIALAEKFLSRNVAFSSYTNDVKTILADCNQLLLDNALVVYDYYFDSKRLPSAKKRLANIRKDFLDIVPTFEKDLLQFECQLAKECKDDMLYAQKWSELNEKFPAYQEELRIAQNKKTKSKKRILF